MSSPQTHLKSEKLLKSPDLSEIRALSDVRRVHELENELDRIREAARLDLENMQADIVAKNRENAKLKRELTGILDPDTPEGQQVKALLDLWWREIKQSAPGVKHDLKSTRAIKVKAALKRRGAETCRKAVLGAQFDDWAMGRNPRTQGREFNDIAEHILHTDGDIERFAKLYDDCYVVAPEVYRRLVEAGGVELPERKHPMRIALEGLRQLACEWRESATPGQYVAQCPLHDDSPWSLYVRMAFGRCRMLCSHGCTEYVLLTAVGFTGPSDWMESPHPVRESAGIDDVIPTVEDAA